MLERHVFWWVGVALVLGAVTGVALAQEGGARPRPPCVAGRRVVRARPAVAPALRACRTHADCAIVLSGCCAPCTEVQPEQVRAVRRGREAAFRRSQCPRTVACPACAGPRPGPELQAICVASRCEVAVDDATCTAPAPISGGDPPAVSPR